MLDNDICTRNKIENIKNQANDGSKANEMKVLRKIVDKTKIERIRSQQIRESYGI